MARKRERRAAKKKNAATKTAPVTPPAPPAPRMKPWKIAVELTMLEIAAGHDGLFRGAPEPVILLGAVLVAQSGAPRVKPLGRALIRLAPEGRFPLAVAPPPKSVLKSRGRSFERSSPVERGT